MYVYNVCLCLSYALTSFATFHFPSIYAHFSFIPNYGTFLSLSPCTCSLSLFCSEHEASHLFNFPEAPLFFLLPQNKLLFIYIPVSLTLWKTSGALVLGGAPSLLFVVCCAVLSPCRVLKTLSLVVFPQYIRDIKYTLKGSVFKGGCKT
jgi:hypothetical protein